MEMEQHRRPAGSTSRWFALAELNGEAKAVAHRVIIEENMPPDQLQLAQTAARSCIVQRKTGSALKHARKPSTRCGGHVRTRHPALTRRQQNSN